MKTNVKQLSDTKVLVTITLDAKELGDAEQVALTKLVKNVKAPGFRKGKVPLNVAAKHVDPNALAQQTMDDALSKAVSEAFVGENIQALDRPQVEIKKFVPSQELEFTAEADVLPKVSLGNYKKLSVKKEVGEVVKADVEDVVERIRKGYAEKKAISRAAKLGDETILDFIGKKDDEPFDGGTATDYALELGSGQFIPGFEDAIVGHRAGDEFDIPLTFPKEYQSEQLAGQKVVFSVTLKTVNEVIIPELTDELAQKAGPFKTTKEMIADIKKELVANREREALEKLKDQLVAKLIEVSKVPVPEILVEDQKSSIEQDMGQNLAYRGMTLQGYLDSKGLSREQWLDTEVKDAAERRVKAGLVLSELSKVENITASDEELAAKINEFQAQYGEKSGQDFTSPEMQRDIANRLLTDKTIDRLVELNK